MDRAYCYICVLKTNQMYFHPDRGCTVNTIHCMYSKLPPEDEQLICSKHVEDITGINLKRKWIWLVLITQIFWAVSTNTDCKNSI